MKLYKARIVGFERSGTTRGYVHPIFEYTDSYGEIRRYVREVGMERTPFTAKRKYTVCKKISETHNKTYEKTEVPIKMWVRWAALFVSIGIAMLINLYVGAFAIACASFCVFNCYASQVRMAMSLRRKKHSLTPIEGKVIGCQERKYKIEGEYIAYEWHPIIEYVYEGKRYQHVSKTQQQYVDCEIGQACNIYIDPKRHTVFDELETKTSIGYEILCIVLPKFFLVRGIFNWLFNNKEYQQMRRKMREERKSDEQKRKVYGTVPPFRRAS